MKLSLRKEKKLHFDGRLYIFDKLNSDGKITFWRCEFKTTGIDKCKGRICTTLEDAFVRIVASRTCDQNPARIVAKEVINGTFFINSVLEFI